MSYGVYLCLGLIGGYFCYYDIRERRLPNEAQWLLAGLWGYCVYTSQIGMSYWEGACGFGVMYVLLISLVFIGYLVTQGFMMGLGDIKLYSVCVMYIGWQYIPYFVFLSVLFAPMGLIFRNEGEMGFPFGPSIYAAFLILLKLVEYNMI